MKKRLPLIILTFYFFAMRSQAYMEGFESSSLPAGWDTLNLSGPTPGSALAWFGSSAYNNPPAAIEGNEFFSANYLTVGGSGTISSWLFTPVRTLTNGDVFTYYTRTLSSPVQYPDRMEIRLSTNGSSINTGTTSSSVGDFSVTLLTINPLLNVAGYPTTWTKYTHTLASLPAGGISGRLAFRYFVTNGGPNGSNSDAIGIDSVYYSPTIGTGIKQTSNSSAFRISPNPSTGIVKALFKVPNDDREIIVQNVLGEMVARYPAPYIENTIDISFLNRGTYFLLLKEGDSIVTEKLILE